MNDGGSLFLAGLASILAAGLAGALGMLVWADAFDPGGLLMVAMAGAIVALPHLLFLGLPIFAVAVTRGKLGWVLSGLAGFLVGGLPLPLLLVGGWGAAPRDAFLLWMLWLGSAGLAGGLAFRAVYGAGADEEGAE